MTATVRPGQTLHDIAIQYLGTNEAVFALAKLNGLDVESDLQAGQVLNLPEVYNKRIRKLYDENGWLPASDTNQLLEGIGYWGIAYTFEVQ